MTKTTHATHYPSLALYNALGVPYIVHGSDWGGPLWTVHAMMLSTVDTYGDAGFFHELCHWIEASPKQRTYPDFSLGKWVNANRSEVFASSTNPTQFHSEDIIAPYKRGPKDSNVGWGERTTSLSEATRQESNACFALWLYEPLVGLWSWDDPPTDPHEINSAAWDFNGFEQPGTVGWPTRVTKRTAKIVKALSPQTSLDTVKQYLNVIHKSQKKVR